MKKKSHKPRVELTPQQWEMKFLRDAYGSIGNRMSYSLSSMTYYDMLSTFNIRTSRMANFPITFKDLESFYETRKQITKDKYDTHKMLQDRAIASEVLREATSTSLTPYEAEPYTDDEVQYPWCDKYPDQACTLITDKCNQPLAAKTIWNNIVKGKTGQMLIADPGLGKTFVVGSVIKNFIEQGFISKAQCLSPWAILYVTRASIVLQTKNDVLRDSFNINTASVVTVVNIEHLRSEFGKWFVREEVTIINGQEAVKFKWTPIHPCLILWDECHALARPMSIQSRIAQAANDVSGLTQIFISATPLSRISEGMCFACSTGKEFNLGGKMVRITNKNWKYFAEQIAAPDEPEDYSEDAIRRFMEFFSDCIVRIKDIHLTYKNIITTQRITFQSDSEKEEYTTALQKYAERKARLEGDSSLTDQERDMCLLAAMKVFEIAAEYCKRYHLARFVVDSWNAGKAPALGLKFKRSLVGVYSILVNDYGWKRENVSFIWGGATESLSAKQKLKKLFGDDKVAELMKSMGVNMKDMGLEDVELHVKTEEQYAFEKEHNLLSQKPIERERERLRYQRQDSRLLLFTYKAGGAGLSAHHEGERYANARQREGLFSPDYSEKMSIQAFGRLARITSTSDTYQKIVYYSGTIEDGVMGRFLMKLKCARHVGSDNYDSVFGVRNTPSNLIDDEDDEDSEPIAMLNNIEIMEEVT